MILSVLWFLGASYYYVCVVKQVCPENLSLSKAHLSEKKDSQAQEEVAPLSFQLNSEDPVLGEGFNTMRDELLGRLGEYDTLVIQGTYMDKEDGGESLAMARADKVKSLFTDYFDPTRMVTQSSFDGMATAQDGQMLESIQFSIISGQSFEYADETENDQTEPEVLPLEEEVGEIVEDLPTPEETSWVEEINGKIVIHFPSDDAHRITSEVDNYLDQLVMGLIQNPPIRVNVEGHTGNEGGQAENYTLGRKQAWVVKKRMWDKGLDHSLIYTSSQGETRPLRTNATEEGRAYNKRVEITIER